LAKKDRVERGSDIYGEQGTFEPYNIPCRVRADMLWGRQHLFPGCPWYSKGSQHCYKLLTGVMMNQKGSASGNFGLY
jgi:hypothetical protein